MPVSGDELASQPTLSRLENRIKELTNGLATDRLSCYGFLANQFRLLLHTFAYCLLWFFREHLALTPSSTAQVDTLRLHFLKIGTRVRTTRRDWLHLATGYPWPGLFVHLVETILLAPA